MMRRSSGFTLIEMLIVIAIASAVLALAAPSMQRMVLLQRLKGVSANLQTDFQLARSEAVARGKNTFVYFKTPGGGASMSCYTLYTDTSNGRFKCDCTLASARCVGTATEIKTVQLPSSESVYLEFPTGGQADVQFDAITGGMFIPTMDRPGALPSPFEINVKIDDSRALRGRVALSGRPTTCVPSGSDIAGYAAC